jgi:hypothetical protein
VNDYISSTYLNMGVFSFSVYEMTPGRKAISEYVAMYFCKRVRVGREILEFPDREINIVL